MDLELASPHRASQPPQRDLSEMLGHEQAPRYLSAIAARIPRALRRHLTPEDIWQDSLVKAWRARETFEWRGEGSFRSWILTIADHCIRDAHDRANARRRCGDLRLARLDAEFERDQPGLTERRTPGHLAIDREQAERICAVVFDLPDPIRDFVRLRLFDSLSLNAIAERLALGKSAVRHRLRRGAELCATRLRQVITQEDHPIPRRSAASAARRQPQSVRASTPGRP